ncbi:hypothetical protein AGOR_G00055520 [Albula goreensis]|uniref:P-selectin glycoprotein ligand 1 n=1 Tax=Albula goreensis TaxID=1534307 RepID=A0A8T3DU85_9TELE|nr:hypothetical protein AGOR_G00055520 [Albula goreensis]
MSLVAVEMRLGLTLFAKMAETWPLLLLLLAMCDPLLSTPLSSDHGNSTQTMPDFNKTEDSAHTIPPHIVTTGEIEELTMATEEDTTPSTEKQEPTTRQIATQSSLSSVQTSEQAADVTSLGPTHSLQNTSTMRAMMTATPVWNTAVSEHPVTSHSTSEAGAETAHPVTTRPVETPAASTSTSTSGSTDTPNSTTIGALVPRVNPGQRSTVKTLVETKPLNTKVTHPGDKGGFQCTPPTRRDGLVGQCLIAIAALAGLATIFIVCTIVLCTKLSSSKYKYKMAQRYGGTEMVCISSLLPDGNGTHVRPRTPKSNGALIPNIEDSEGDDLTLHSFLPDTGGS